MILIFKDGKYTIIFFRYTLWQIFFIFLVQKPIFESKKHPI